MDSENRFPKQVKFIVGNEACERFCYYGIKGILVMYITRVLLKSEDQATEIIHLFGFVNYFMPLLGGWVSDRFWGRYKTIFWISLLYCAGSAVLAFSDLHASIEYKTWCLGIGLALIAFGSGGIKPCVSAFMGDQFQEGKSHLLQKAYAAFYWSINLGSFFSFLVIPGLAHKYGYGAAFAVPGIFMAIATLIFWLGRKFYHKIPPSQGLEKSNFCAIVFSSIKAKLTRATGEDCWALAREKFGDISVNNVVSVLRVLGIFSLIPVFWALFEQNSSTWVLQGKMMDSFKIFGFTIGAEQMQTANPAFVMILVPLLTVVLYPRLKAWSTPLRRMGLGLVVAAISYLIVAFIQWKIEAGAQLSLAWQVVPYIVITIAEVLISTTGLEFAFTQAPKSMRSTIMSFWHLTVACGHLIVVVITAFLSSPGAKESVSSGRFLLYAVATFVVAGVFALVSSRYRYRRAEDN